MAFGEREIAIMRDAYGKLDNMPLSFGIPRYSDEMSDDDVSKYMGGDLKDVMRELGVRDLGGIVEMSAEELHVENRIVYYALRRFRHSASVFFKFSTAVDATTVAKQQIPKMIAEMLKEYEQEWTSWRRTLSSGQIWQMESTVVTNGEYSSTSS